MTVEFAGEGKYESQWHAFDDGYASQAELVNAYLAEILRLREVADAANELANTHFGVIDVRLDQESVRERFFAALEAVFGPSVKEVDDD